MGRPLYSKAYSSSSSSQSSIATPASPTFSASTGPLSTFSDQPPQRQQQYSEVVSVPEKWSAVCNNFDPDSDEFWARENTVYEAFVDLPLHHASRDENNTSRRMGMVLSGPDEEDEIALSLDGLNTGFAQQRGPGSIVGLEHPRISTHAVPFSFGPGSTPTSPIADALINPSLMAVGGDDPIRLFADWERRLHQLAGPQRGTTRPPPFALSLSIPSVAPVITSSVSGTGPMTGDPTAAMTVHTPTSPVPRIGTGLGGSRRIRRASAAAANAGWTSRGAHSSATIGAYNNATAPVPASPTSDSRSRAWNVRADDAQLPITMDITPIPIPYHTSGTGGTGERGTDATASPALSMIFTPSPAPSITPRMYHWDWTAPPGHYQRQLPTLSLPPMPVSPSVERTRGTGGVSLSHVVMPIG